MTPLRRFTSFLNIKPGEERLIGWLTLLYFILSLGFVFVQSMAFGIFLAEYGVGGLPYSYVLIAVVASSMAALYIRLSGRVSFSRLLLINLVFLGAVSVLIWVALKSPLYHVIAFILPLWFQMYQSRQPGCLAPGGSLFVFGRPNASFRYSVQGPGWRISSAVSSSPPW
jgi:hypothetical protein